MAADSSDRPRAPDPVPSFRDIVIVGGGCYGSFYAGQLLEARRRGKVGFARLLAVDRAAECRAAREFAGAERFAVVQDEWAGFFDRYLAGPPGPADDAVIPSPLMPHLFLDWLLRRARARWPGRRFEAGPLPGEVGTPYERRGGDGSTYLSFADWICPTHCTEPALCPVIRGPRTWDMGEALARHARVIGAAGPALFTVRHLVHGVGGFTAASIRSTETLLAEAVAAGFPTLAVGTVSSCHGAAGLLSIGAPGTAGR
jgi:hypothetical protein